MQKREKKKKTQATLTKKLGRKGLKRLTRRKAQLAARDERRLVPPPPPVVDPDAPPVFDEPGPPPEPAPQAELGPGAPAQQAPPSGGHGEWRVVETTGGWLRWSEIEGRVDAHCRGHPGGAKCAMNRQLKAGALGLCLLWLERGHARLSRYDHELEKEALSSADALTARREARRLFRARAADSPDVSELVELEARICGGYVEPSTLSCPSLHKTLVRLMNNPENSLV